MVCVLTVAPPVEAQRFRGGTWIEGTNFRTLTDANPTVIVTVLGRTQFGWYCDDSGVIRALVKGVAPSGAAPVELEHSVFHIRSPQNREGPVRALWSAAPEIPELSPVRGGWRMLGAEESQALRETLSRTIENSTWQGRDRWIVFVAIAYGDAREQFSLDHHETAIQFLNCAPAAR